MPAVDVPGCTASPPRGQPHNPRPYPLSYVMFPLSGAELFSLPLALRWNFLCLIAAQREVCSLRQPAEQRHFQVSWFFIFLRGGDDSLSPARCRYSRDPERPGLAGPGWARSRSAAPAAPRAPRAALTSLFNPSLAGQPRCRAGPRAAGMLQEVGAASGCVWGVLHSRGWSHGVCPCRDVLALEDSAPALRERGLQHGRSEG